MCEHTAILLLLLLLNTAVMFFSFLFFEETEFAKIAYLVHNGLKHLKSPEKSTIY